MMESLGVSDFRSTPDLLSQDLPKELLVLDVKQLPSGHDSSCL